MDNTSTGSSPSMPTSSSEDRLESWKEIANYPRREVRTVQRWEKAAGLPVRRLQIERQGGVYAYKSELDVWYRDRGSQLDGESAASAARFVPDIRRNPVRAVRLIALLISVALLILAVVLGLRLYRGTASSALSPAIVPFISLRGLVFSPTFSPDGTQMAFAWQGEDGVGFDVYLAHGSSLQPKRLTFRPSRLLYTQWSPDGRSIGFARQTDTESGIFVVPSEGGSEKKLLSLDWRTRWEPSVVFAWTPDGKGLVFSQTDPSSHSSRIAILSLATLQYQAITDPPSGWHDDSFAISQDGKRVVFLRRGPTDSGGIFLVGTSGGEAKQLAAVDGGALGGLAWLPDGQGIILAGRQKGTEGLWKIPPNGEWKLFYPTVKKRPSFPVFSPRGDRFALGMVSFEESVWQSDLMRRVPARNIIGTVDVASEFPQYSPDGKRIAYQSDRSGTWEVWSCDRDGSSATQLTSFGSPAGYPRWSPDSKQIAFDVRGEQGSEIYTIGSAGGTPQRIATSSSYDETPSWSHDGRWIYFASERGGVWQLWKIPTAGGAAVQITRGGGYAPLESHDGKFVYYAKGRASSGIWRVDRDGNETAFTDILPPGHWADWTIGVDGIYLIDPLAVPNPAIEFVSYGTRRVRVVAPLENYPEEFMQGLDVSTDRRWVAYPKLRMQTDIVLMQNVR